METSLIPIKRQMDNENALHTYGRMMIITKKSDIMKLKRK